MALLLLLQACASMDGPASGDDLSKFLGMQANDILFLQGEDKIAAFRNAGAIAPTRVVKAADKPLPLPASAAVLPDFSFEFQGETLDLDDYFARLPTAGLIAIKDGEVLLERYALGNDRDSRWISFSVAKSVVSLLIGAAIQDGYIRSVDQKVTDFLPLLKGSAYEQASIRNLLQMASGVAWDEDYADPESDVAGANYATLPLYDHLRQKDAEAAAGEKFNYNTAETNLVGTLLRAAIGNNLSTYLQDKIWQSFGMESDAYWQLTEEAGGEFGGCCINATLRDYARIGLFALANGQLADGRQILPASWMQDSTSPSPGFDGYGYFWWLAENGIYQAQGIFGQGIYINPATKTVIAMHGAWDTADNEASWALMAAMNRALDQAMTKASSD